MEGEMAHPGNDVEWPEAWGSLPLPGPSGCVPRLCPSSVSTLRCSASVRLEAWEPHEQGSNPTPNSAADWGVAPAPPSLGGVTLPFLRVEVWLQRARQPWAWAFSPPQRPLPNPSPPDPQSPRGNTRRIPRLLMTLSEFPGGHWLTHPDTVETGARIKEGATGISHTRRRAVNENKTPASAASPLEAPGSRGARMQTSGRASGVLSVSTPTRT